MADVEALIPSLGYAPTFQKNILGSIRRCPDVYGETPERISACSTAFTEKWGRGQIRGKIPACFKTENQFRTWRKNVRMVLIRLEDGGKPAAKADDCDAILAYVRANQGKNRLLGANSDLTISVVLREAAKTETAVAAISQAWIDETSLALTTTNRKSFRRGIAGLNRLIAATEIDANIAILLPKKPLPDPTALRPDKGAWRRRASNPAAAQIWKDFDRIMHIKMYGTDEDQFFGTPRTFKASSAASYETALNWLLRELAALGRLSGTPGLKQVITSDNLYNVSQAWMADRQGRGLPTDTSTLHNHIAKMANLAVNHLDATKAEADRFKLIQKNDVIRNKSVGHMSVRRLDWIKDFARDEAKQHKAMFLPEILMKRADAILDRWDAGGKPLGPTQKMLALKLGITATQIAILFRAAPIRSANLRHLTMRGKAAGLDVTALERDPRLTELRLWVCKSTVKNGVDIEQMGDKALGPVVAWYLKRIRARLVADHPFNKNYIDSDYLFPSTHDGPMERSNFAATFREGCRAVGFDMEMHQARHVSAYWILSIDPNAWGEAAALLGDDEMTVRNYYGWLDTRLASEKGRQKLQELHTAGRKNKRGSYEGEL
ncbi:hypothetical protein QCN27_19735 [Cereibacter sp. SYSU M97828]|nr:hypothetical protein [Cereibacter flavus]